MNPVPLYDDVSGFAPNAILIGESSRADRIWTRDEFMRLCELMRNGNPADEFLRAYRDSNGVAHFVKSKVPKVEQIITWSRDTITGRAKHVLDRSAIFLRLFVKAIGALLSALSTRRWLRTKARIAKYPSFFVR
jgi:hypothetical protein